MAEKPKTTKPRRITLKQAREAKKLSQVALSELTKDPHVDQATISRLEKPGRIKRPQFETIRSIAEALEMPVEQLRF